MVRVFCGLPEKLRCSVCYMEKGHTVHHESFIQSSQENLEFACICKIKYDRFFHEFKLFGAIEYTAYNQQCIDSGVRECLDKIEIYYHNKFPVFELKLKAFLYYLREKEKVQ